MSGVEPDTSPECASVSPAGSSLVSATGDIFYRTKAAAVWWMLRSIVGDDALKQALQTYRLDAARLDRDPAGLQHTLGKILQQGPALVLRRLGLPRPRPARPLHRQRHPQPAHLARRPARRMAHRRRGAQRRLRRSRGPRHRPLQHRIRDPAPAHPRPLHRLHPHRLRRHARRGRGQRRRRPRDPDQPPHPPAPPPRPLAATCCGAPSAGSRPRCRQSSRACASAFLRSPGASKPRRLFASRLRSFYTDICGSSVCGVTVQLWFRLDGEG